MTGSAAALISPGELDAFGPAWDRLWSACADAYIFQSPAWVLAWAASYAPGRCWAAVALQEGLPVAILPVFGWDGALLLAGSGPSDRATGLWRPEAAPMLPDLLALAADRLCVPGDRIDLQQLDPGSALAAIDLPGWSAQMSDGEDCLVLPLDGPDGMGRVPAPIQADWRYATRRIERLGGRIRLAAADEIRPTIDALVRLHGARWAARGEAGMLADPLMRGLVTAAGEALDRVGRLRLYRLDLDGATVAVLLAMRGQRALHYYLGGFDPAHARLSPGAILIGRAIRDAAAEGLGAFDFLRGAEPYKARWGATPRPLHRLVFTRG